MTAPTAPVAPVRVLLADDNAVLRMGMASLLASDPRITLVAEAENGLRAVELAEEHRPDVVVLDVRMPEMDGVAAAARMPSGTRILMLTYSEEPEVITTAMASGAHGYLVHGAHSPEEILDAVMSAARGMSVFGPAASAVLLDPARRAAVPPGSGPALPGAAAPPTGPGSPAAALRARRYGLTPREVEILDLMAEGRGNRDIAKDCFLAEKTVKNHINRIFTKLGVTTRGEAISLWLRPPS
ncbi:response regulator [Nocardioides mesophilus]|uniref:Response regulator transcription factor n=1 Tax=Nocardioides mesophilus TaxID=433659 RepID=A0A7G9REY5_9ACTN|nr:response regulator transcription factor [Nocardioides mesophilus]QNN54160.1 response regulator transcription factor [Nocardioides mesophilus]